MMAMLRICGHRTAAAGDRRRVAGGARPVRGLAAWRCWMLALLREAVRG